MGNVTGTPMAYSPPQVARLLGLSEGSVRKALRNGEIRGTRVGGRWLVSAQWLNDWLAGSGT